MIDISWIIAHVVDDLVKESRQSNSSVVYRQLGSSLDSSDVLQLIMSIDFQIAMLYGRPAEVPISSTFENAANWFSEGSAFDCASRSHPLVIVLDGFDHLNDIHRVLDDIGQWCPGVRHPLPPHVKLIISSNSTVKGWNLKDKIRLRFPDSGTTEQCIDNSFLKVADLPHHDFDLCKKQYEEILKCRPRSGSILQVKRLLSACHLSTISEILVTNPFAFASQILLNIVLKWPSYHVDNGALHTAAKGGVAGLINLELAELEERHGKILVAAVLSLITLSKDGLSVNEIEDLVSTMNGVLDDIFEWWTPPVFRVPPMLIHRVV